MKQSSAEDVAIAAKKLIDAAASYPNFVLTIGCDAPSLAIPEENNSD